MKNSRFILGVTIILLSCKQGPKPIEEAGPKEKTYAEIGMEYTQETQKVLGQNLMQTIQTKGVEEAIVFCNEKAYPLTDSMATKFNAQIKRVSDKPRNPNNKADDNEIAQIEAFKAALAAGDSITPIIQEEIGKVYFYYPIVTKGLCLNCHGKPEENISKEALLNLTQLYPNDQATGYGVDEVRGIWSIVFDAVQPQKQQLLFLFESVH